MKNSQQFLLVPAEEMESLKQMTSEILKHLCNPEEKEKEIDGYITEKEARALINRKTTWFYNKRKEGYLPYRKLGATVYYKKSDLFNLLNCQEDEF